MGGGWWLLVLGWLGGLEGCCGSVEEWMKGVVGGGWVRRLISINIVG